METSRGLPGLNGLKNPLNPRNPRLSYPPMAAPMIVCVKASHFTPAAMAIVLPKYEPYIRASLCVYFPCMDHSFQDAVSLELARRIANGLPEHPEWLDLARANLNRWTHRNSNAPSLLRCYDEWRALLQEPVTEICAALTAETEEGGRMRHNSPFAGALPPADVWKIKARLRHATSAA